MRLTARDGGNAVRLSGTISVHAPELGLGLGLELILLVCFISKTTKK
ncbi:MAG: hypothetical protein HFP77_07525 [Methylococcales symbiont of Iophon sp. n. MRB-2018]|nr:MAG: hypothetical protein HFP77_07525 [Methylococcales symbiont of Iophon sp. n. MRB-2018]KAF3979468.1 MAG: hypothetical protein HFP76_07190 [Methylococcales symbiont of Iophon sp. n. MRB-2018]